MSAPCSPARPPTATRPEGAEGDNPCEACGRPHARPSCPPKALLEGIAEVLDELHRLADAGDSVARSLERLVDRSGPLYATNPTDGRSTVPVLESMSWRLWEIGTLLNVTPTDIQQLGLAHPDPPDPGGIESARRDLTDAVDALPAKLEEARAAAGRRAPARRQPSRPDDDAPEIAEEL